MGRYLCHLCYTIVNYGEKHPKHPCVTYKNDNNVYSLPELGESNKMDTKHGDLTANSNDNSVIRFPEEQQNDAEISEQRSTWFTERHRKFSLRNSSKIKGRSNSFSCKVSNTEQGSPSNTLLSGQIFNVHSSVVHSIVNKTACMLNSLENFESAYRCQGDIRGASKRKLRRPFLLERSEGKKTDSISFQAATNEKCETSHDGGIWHTFIEDETYFSKSLENVSQKSKFHSKNVSSAPNFPNFSLPPRFIETGKDVIKASRDAHFNSNTSIPKPSTCIYKGRLRSKDIPVSTLICEKISFVPEQMCENNNEEAQHKIISEIYSKGINNRSNVFAENAISLASMSDADPISGHSRMNVEAEIRPGPGNFVCTECGKSFIRKGHLVDHYRTHTGEKPFPCNRCDKRFSRKDTLTTHLRTHSGEKPYSCDQCVKSFSTKSNLNTHRRTHTEERPYKCTLCEKAFRSSSNRNEHYKNVHNKK